MSDNKRKNNDQCVDLSMQLIISFKKEELSILNADLEMVKKNKMSNEDEKVPRVVKPLMTMREIIEEMKVDNHYPEQAAIHLGKSVKKELEKISDGRIIRSKVLQKGSMGGIYVNLYYSTEWPVVKKIIRSDIAVREREKIKNPPKLPFLRTDIFKDDSKHTSINIAGTDVTRSYLFPLFPDLFPCKEKGYDRWYKQTVNNKGLNVWLREMVVILLNCFWGFPMEYLKDDRSNDLLDGKDKYLDAIIVTLSHVLNRTVHSSTASLPSLLPILNGDNSVDSVSASNGDTEAQMHRNKRPHYQNDVDEINQLNEKIKTTKIMITTPAHNSPMNEYTMDDLARMHKPHLVLDTSTYRKLRGSNWKLAPQKLCTFTNDEGKEQTGSGPVYRDEQVINNKRREFAEFHKCPTCPECLEILGSSIVDITAEESTVSAEEQSEYRILPPVGSTVSSNISENYVEVVLYDDEDLDFALFDDVSLENDAN